MQQQMEYIYTIYRLGSIRQAAEQLCISQPALSISLKRAEKELGEQIFDRSKHPLEPTPAGQVYLNSILKIRQIEENMKAEIEDLASMNTGSLTIGGTQYFNSCILPPVLKHYMDLYPGIEVSIVESHSDEILKKLLNHEIDLMFNARIFDPEQFIVQPIFQDMLFIAVPPALITNFELKSCGMTHHDIYSKHYRDLPFLENYKLLENLPFILLTSENNLYLRSMEFFQYARISPVICMQVQQLTTAHYFACNGIGATFTTNRLIQQTADSGLLYYKVDFSLMTRNFNLIFPRTKYLSNAARKFIAMCKSDLI